MTFLFTATALHVGGYKVIPIPHGKKFPNVDNWQKIDATLDDLKDWSTRYGTIGILAKHTPAVDLDIRDEAFSLELGEWVLNTFGWAPERIGLAPKRMFIYRTDEPFSKVQSSVYVDDYGMDHKVEILCDGQQFVAYGQHPDTKRDYVWTGETLVNIPVEDLTVLTRDDAIKIVEKFDEMCDERGWSKRVAAAKKREAAARAVSDDPLASISMPMDRITPEEIEACVMWTEGYEDYDTWAKMGMALHHQFGGSDEGLALWDKWSQQAFKYDGDAVRKKWSDDDFKDLRAGGALTLRSYWEPYKTWLAEHVKNEFNEIREQIETYLGDQVSDLLKAIPERIAKTDFDSSQIDMLISAIRKRVKKVADYLPTVGSVKAAIRRAAAGPSSGSASELEIALARKVLAMKFDDGEKIMRFAKSWWLYESGIWRMSDDDYVSKQILNAFTELRRTKDKTIKMLLSQMDESRGDRLHALVGTITSMIGTMVAEQTNSDPLNLSSFAAPRVMNTLSHELWFKNDGSFDVRPHSPDSHLTSQLACEYDDLASCPTWDNACRLVFRNCEDPEGMIRHFHELMGYLIQPTRDAATWVLFKGPGNNGKSFLLKVISILMGRGSVLGASLAEIAKNGDTHFGDALVGKLMLLDDDLKTGTMLPDDWLKKLSEAKLMTANPKHGRRFEITARAVPVILSNHWPAIVDLSEGLRRRVQVFEMNSVIAESERNPRHMPDILDDELPGVLNRLIQGFSRFLKRDSRFDVPAEMLKSKQTWLENSNPTLRFLADNTRPDGSCKAADLYDAYQNWAEYWEHSIKPLGRNRFYQAVEAMGIAKFEQGSISYFGVRIITRHSIFD